MSGETRTARELAHEIAYEVIDAGDCHCGERGEVMAAVIERELAKIRGEQEALIAVAVAGATNAARNAALEEAAREAERDPCDYHDGGAGSLCGLSRDVAAKVAARIRALKRQRGYPCRIS